MDRTSAARKRRNATARCSAAIRAASPWAAPRASRISNSDPSRVLPIAAAPTRGTPRRQARGRELFRRWFRAWSAIRCRAGTVVMIVEDREEGCRAPNRCSGYHLPGGRLQQGDGVVIDHHGDSGPDQPGGYRIAGRAYRTQESRSTCGSLAVVRSAGAARAAAAQLGFDDQPLIRITQISEWTVALTSAHQSRAAALAVPRSSVRPVMAASVSSGTARSRVGRSHWVLHDALGLRVRRGRSPGRTVSGGQAHVVRGGDHDARDHPPLRQAIRSASTWASTPRSRRRLRRSTPKWWMPAGQWRKPRTASGRTPAPRRTGTTPVRPGPQSMTRYCPVTTAGRRHVTSRGVV